MMHAEQPFQNLSINPDTGNPNERTTPEHRLSRVYARGENVVVVGTVGGEDVEREITRSEAISRAQALSEMAGRNEYVDERRHLQDIVDQFISAIKKAKENSGNAYRSSSVSMFVPGAKASLIGK